MPKKYLPVYSINVPGGGIQQPMTIPNDAPVFSSYTGNLVGYGPQRFGIPNDAPSSHSNYGGIFHVIVHNPANDSYMEHGK